jgi:solute carrier family 35 (UDP-sugar transporter), member A1/2/3
MALLVAVLGAAGGLLVALSIKYGDAILKTLATTAAIILSSVLDNLWLGGPLTPVMMIAGAQVIVAICNYTFDATPPGELLKKSSDRPAHRTSLSGRDDEEIALIETKDRDGSENDDSDQNHQPVADGNRR